MGILSFLSRNFKLTIAVSIVFAGIIFQNELQSLYKSFSKSNNNSKYKTGGLMTQEELSKFNGIDNKKLYLALLGTIYDVTKSKMHYGKGGAYQYFVGKDGSRAFITGHFKDESVGKDHALDLSCDDIFGLIGWLNTFHQKYTNVGVLMGRYYDENGKPTAYSKQFGERLLQCETEKELAKREEEKYPPCNMEWSEEEGSRVWCTKNSGGIQRGWVGVPRQYYTPGQEHPRCVCVNHRKEKSNSRIKEYEGCSPDSSFCIIRD